MGGTDMFINWMLPKLVPIAYLDVGKIVLIVIVQRVKVNVAVSSELVGEAVISPVYISKKKQILSYRQMGPEKLFRVPCPVWREFS